MAASVNPDSGTRAAAFIAEMRLLGDACSRAAAHSAVLTSESSGASSGQDTTSTPPQSAAAPPPPSPAAAAPVGSGGRGPHCADRAIAESSAIEGGALVLTPTAADSFVELAQAALDAAAAHCTVAMGADPMPRMPPTDVGLAEAGGGPRSPARTDVASMANAAPRTASAPKIRKVVVVDPGVGDGTCAPAIAAGAMATDGGGGAIGRAASSVAERLQADAFVAWAAGYVAVAASDITRGAGHAADAPRVIATVETIVASMLRAFAAVGPDGFATADRVSFQHGGTLALCGLLSLGLKEDVVRLLVKMWDCRVPVLSARVYDGPVCLCGFINTIHIFLKKKKWPETAVVTTEAVSAYTAGAVLCTHCGAAFKSRNALFRHLERECTVVPRDVPLPSAGAAVIEPPASGRAGRTGKTAKVPGTAGGAGVKTGPRPPPPPPLISPAAAKVWFGDIPAELCTAAKIREVLYRVNPPHFPMPYVEKVIRKGYRRSAGPGRHRPPLAERAAAAAAGAGLAPASAPAPPLAEKLSAALGTATPAPAVAAGPVDAAESAVPFDEGSAAGDGGPDAVQPEKTKAPKQPWLGYAFICFRDHAEAAEAIATLNCVAYSPTFHLRLKWATKTGEPPGPVAERRGRVATLRVGQDPLLSERLVPRSFSAAQRATSVERHRVNAGLAPAASFEDVLEHYTAAPRVERPCSGAPVAADVTELLLDRLRTVRWPAARARPAVRSQHYLLLYCNRPNAGFEPLAAVVWSILERYHPAYPCTMVAVTKNFEGSPHTDDRDVTHQLALSVGDWEGGGELCVESEVPNEVCVVTTRNHIAAVDGRFVHWVRGWGAGDRFSIIYFCTNVAKERAPTTAVLE